MTVLHSVMAGRFAARRAGEPSCWPAGTQHTTDDILIRGESLAAAARAGDIPLVRIGERPASPGVDEGRQRFVTVLVTVIEHVDRLGGFQRPCIWIDAALRECEPIIEAARIVGRPTTTHRRTLRLQTEREPGAHLDLRLPADVRAGDLLAIPCSGTVARSQVTNGQRHLAAGLVAPGRDADGDSPFLGVCGK